VEAPDRRMPRRVGERGPAPSLRRSTAGGYGGRQRELVGMAPPTKVGGGGWWEPARGSAARGSWEVAGSVAPRGASGERRRGGGTARS
jgi:hypothetical protein